MTILTTNDQFGIISKFIEKEGLPSVSLLSSEGSGAFEILVSTLLSARTRDDVTLSATKRLFTALAGQDGPTQMRALSAMAVNEIEKLIYPVAFFRQKAISLQKMATQLLIDFGTAVPANIDDLVSLQGVGVKTASLVLGLAFGKPAICVDVHVQRISYRLGWTNNDKLLRSKKEPPGNQPPNVEDTRVQLESLFPPKYWIDINTVLVRFGQTVCTPQSPRCSICPVRLTCPRNSVRSTR